MIVVDASAMIEALVGAAPDEELLTSLTGEIHAPHLLDVEAISVLRGLCLGGRIDEARADAARHDFRDLTVHRHETAALEERIWRLRHQYTAYDAGYIALAEALEVPLLTCDAKLDSGGHGAQVRVLGRS